MSLSIGAARLDLVLDAVDAGEHQRREREVRVRRRVGEAGLDALGLRVRAGDRDPDRGGAVARGVDQRDRRLEARHQAVVGVHRRVGERQQRRGVLQDAADVPAGHVGQAAVAGLVVEQRLAVLPERLVHVHARAVVAEDRLRHEGDRLAVLPGGVLDEVLELHHVVRGLEQRVEAVVDLRLAGGADLVVGALDEQAGGLEVLHHLVAQVAVVVVRRDGEVAALEAGLVAEVVALLARVPPALDGVDVVVALVGGGGVADVVEDVELGLGREERGVRDAGGRRGRPAPCARCCAGRGSRPRR